MIYILPVSILPKLQKYTTRPRSASALARLLQTDGNRNAAKLHALAIELVIEIVRGRRIARARDLDEQVVAHDIQLRDAIARIARPFGGDRADGAVSLRLALVPQSRTTSATTEMATRPYHMVRDRSSAAVRRFDPKPMSRNTTAPIAWMAT